MITSIHTEKAIVKIQDPFIITLNKLGTEEGFLNLIPIRNNKQV